MIKEIKLPEIADNIDTAVVLSILVSVGDIIKEDDNIAEMESDKAAFDLPSDVAGEIKEIKVSVGDEVKVGQVVMTVETDSEEKEEEKTDEDDREKEKKEKHKEKEETDEEADEEEREDRNRGASTDSDSDKDLKEKPQQEKPDSKKEGERHQETQKQYESKEKVEVAAAPSVRRLARELGVDIYMVEGTGSNDRITADDIKAYSKEIARKFSEKDSIQDDYQLPDFSVYGNIERKPLNSIRKRIATNMQSSWQTIPHVFQFDKADITNLEAFRKKYGKEVEKEGGKLTITAILVKIMAQALKTFPNFNASLDTKNEEIIFKEYYHIGVAVDTERGLLVPVIRDVDKKSIVRLSIELGEIAGKARNKKIKPDELQGGNIAISNLGGIGGTNFTPIVYRPNVAVLGVSQPAQNLFILTASLNQGKCCPYLYPTTTV
jgi:pyruvate dehydrogenase E2 component (dihydrolipoamide acetyltransferase)